VPNGDFGQARFRISALNAIWTQKKQTTE